MERVAEIETSGDLELVILPDFECAIAGFSSNFGAALGDMRACCSISPSLRLPLSAFFAFFGHFGCTPPLQLFLPPYHSESLSVSLSLGRGTAAALPEKSAFSTNNRSWAIIRKARFKSPVEFAPLPLVQYVNYGLTLPLIYEAKKQAELQPQAGGQIGNKARHVDTDERRKWRICLTSDLSG